MANTDLEKLILKYPNKDWNWEGISKNPNISIEFIETYTDKPWCWKYGVSDNPNLTMDFIEKFIDKQWDWVEISENLNITMEFIEAYPDKDWDWYSISRNPNITMDIIEKNPDKPWEWAGISINPNLTIKFVEKHKPWDWFSISLNDFGYFNNNPIDYYKKRKNETIKKTKIIKEELIMKTWDPDRLINWCFDIEERKEWFDNE